MGIVVVSKIDRAELGTPFKYEVVFRRPDGNEHSVFNIIVTRLPRMTMQTYRRSTQSSLSTSRSNSDKRACTTSLSSAGETVFDLSQSMPGWGDFRLLPSRSTLTTRPPTRPRHAPLIGVPRLSSQTTSGRSRAWLNCETASPSSRAPLMGQAELVGDDLVRDLVDLSLVVIGLEDFRLAIESSEE